MKNFFNNLNSIVRIKVLLFSFFLFIVQITYSQCTVSSFVVTRNNATCFSNGDIRVSIPTGQTSCETRFATLVPVTGPSNTPVPSQTQTLTFPSTGGEVVFGSLPAGRYNIATSDGITTTNFASNPVIITSNYVPMTLNLSSTAPTCSVSNSGYIQNGTFTATVSGGTGPFDYKLTSAFGVQTVSSNARTHVFNNIRAGENVTIEVTDKVNGNAGCQVSVTQSHVTSTAVPAPLSYGFRAYNFIRDCSDPQQSKIIFYINLSNLTPARLAVLQQPGNAKITIAGVDYPLTYVPARNGFMYNPVAVNGPQLVHNMSITTSFNWECGILTRTSPVQMPDNWFNLSPRVIVDNDCSLGLKLRFSIFGDQDYVQGPFVDRNVYFCPTNSVEIARRISTGPDVYQVLSGSDISPDPALTTNDLNVSSDPNASIPSASSTWTVNQGGYYRITVSDGYHTVVNYHNAGTLTNPIANVTVNPTASVIAGTVGFSFPIFNSGIKYPVTVQVERTDGQTQINHTAAEPLSLAGTYTYNFPMFVTWNSDPGSLGGIYDLPPGQYRFTLTDACSNTRVFTSTNTNVANYTPTFTVNQGCNNSNSISFNLNRNGFAFGTNWAPTADVYLYAKNSSGGFGNFMQAVARTGNGSGTFVNLPSGSYFIQFNGIGLGYSTGEKRASPTSYFKEITIPDYQNFTVSTGASICDVSSTNSGIISAQITGGTYTYPITYSLFSTTSPSTPIATHIENDTTKTEHSFLNLSTGSYFVRVASSCYSVDQNVSLSSTITQPRAIVSDPVVCPMSPTTLGAISATNGLYDITWTDDADPNQTVLADGMPVTLSPSATIKYRATFRLKNALSCSNPPTYTSTVDVRVDANPDVTLAVSDINLCLTPATKTVTISNTQAGYTYEIVKMNGDSLIPRLAGTGTGGNLTISFPSGFIFAAGTTLRVKTSNGANSKCTDFLTDLITIFQSTPIDTLAVESTNVCQGFSSTIKVKASQSQVVYLIKKNGVAVSSIPVQTGNGSDLTFTIPANQLTVGDNIFTVQASNSTCTTIDLINSATITVTASPVANAGAAFIKTCITNPSGKEIGMTAVSGINYSWSPTTGLSDSTISNPVANPTGTTNYTLTAADGTCTASSSVLVSVVTTVPLVNAGADFTKTCSVNPSGKSIGAVIQGQSATYAWTPTTGLTSPTNTITNANPSTTTTYRLTATETSSGCTNFDEVVVTVDTSQPNVPVIQSIDHPTCLNSTGTITVTSTGNPNDRYSIDDGVTFQSSNIFNNVAAGSYLVKVKSGLNSCNSNATLVIVNQQPLTPLTPTITTTTTTTFCQGGSVILESSATSGNQWFKDGNVISGATSRSLTVIESGSYTVNVSNGQCTSVASSPVVVTVNPSVSPIPITSAIANNCPLETVDLTTLQPPPATGIEYEWWTGTTTSRTGTAKISNTTNYNTSGAVFLWSKSTSDACYSLEGQRVDVVITPCCVANVGIIENTNPTGLVHYAPADINGYEHNNSSTPNKTVYVLVNELDQKIKYVNTVSPQFTGVAAGNYRLHALVFGPTVNPTGIVVGNAINQIQIPDYCGSTASYAVQVVPGNCISNASFTESIPNAKQYALLDTTTNQFVQVNTTGIFTTAFNGMLYQVVGFNYTGTASGIVVGGTVSGVSATGLETMAGSMVKGCTAITMQIKGVLYNDRDKNCREGNDNQEGLPRTTIYLKLLNSNRQVIKVTSTDGDALHYFTFNADLIDGTYSIILDNNADLTDNTATYPAFWKGSIQTFTIVSGRIIEQLSNTPNFVPMCLQSSTEKPAPRKTPNLQGNTYHFCFNQTATAINVDADSGAEINWYTSPTGGSASKTAPIPNTKVIGVEVCYVSQTLNGAESERTEIKIEVHPLPELPSVISGPIVVGSETTQLYSIASSSNLASYNWTLPTDWIGNSVTEQLNVIVGKQGGTIKVNAISANGCVGPEQQLDVRVVIEDDIEIYNSISPNGDGVNDELIIRNIDFYPNNTLEIYNRWGVLVYQADGYGQKNVLFKGLSDGRTTINRNEELPEGTYFYTLMYVNSKGIQRQKAGYLYIKQ